MNLMSSLSLLGRHQPLRPLVPTPIRITMGSPNGEPFVFGVSLFNAARGRFNSSEELFSWSKKLLGGIIFRVELIPRRN
jgi:hypothetical protein